MGVRESDVTTFHYGAAFSWSYFWRIFWNLKMKKKIFYLKTNSFLRKKKMKTKIEKKKKNSRTPQFLKNNRLEIKNTHERLNF